MDYLHSCADYALSWCKLVQNRQVGWKTKVRKTGEIVREQQPLAQKARLLLLFNPVTEWVDRTSAFRMYMHNKTDQEGEVESSPASKQQIQAFVDFYGINMADFQPSDIHAYSSFQEFFIRHHTPSSRPIAAKEDPTVAVISADCRLVVFDTVAETSKLWIKGQNFSMAQLIEDKEAARPWANGAVASFRLSPQDYHRYHSPVRGTLRWWKTMKGEYYEVDPMAVRSDINVLAANARSALCIASEEFGDVLFVAIGASEVGTVKLSEKITSVPASTKIDPFAMTDIVIEKGEEVGLFEFGGSSVVVAFEPGRITFDEDLRETSKELIEMDVEMGMSLGKATNVVG